ncbi:MAG: BCD family MFS transporter [Myxococcaceae bacterium]|nr:BCD family MFS transporter [Myxococcaceae bacterium]
MQRSLSWVSIVRLGLVQTALGAVVVLTTSTLNRVMVVELALPAMLPGALVALHHAMQLLRPRMGHGSDGGRRLTPWILGGMAVLGVGGVGAALGTALMPSVMWAGLALSAVSFALIGAGVSSAGTSLLVMLAKRVAPGRRGAAATVVWMMMIFGFALTATLVGKQLEPFSMNKLIVVALAVSLIAFAVAALALWGVEGREPSGESEPEPRGRFSQTLREVWAEPDARRFTVFVFVSMLAYSAQDLVLEPFAGSSFGFSPGESTKLSGVQHAGVFAGMLLVAVLSLVFKDSLKRFVLGGCFASAIAMGGLVVAGLNGGGSWPLKQNVFLLGAANGVFSIAAIGAMMALASQGKSSREGVRMGLWGAAQAIAFGAGGFLGTVVVDAARALGASGGHAYAVIFALETLGFFAAYALAAGVTMPVSGRGSAARSAAAPAVVPSPVSGQTRSAA